MRCIYKKVQIWWEKEILNIKKFLYNIKEINNINFFSINTYIDYDENKENQEKVDIILNHIKENADKLN